MGKIGHGAYLSATVTATAEDIKVVWRKFAPFSYKWLKDVKIS